MQRETETMQGTDRAEPPLKLAQVIPGLVMVCRRGWLLAQGCSALPRGLHALPARLPDLCRVGCPALPRGWRPFAAWVALCRAGGGALQVGWSCFAAQVQRCRVSDRILTGFGAYGGNPGGKARPTRQSKATRAAERDPRGKPRPPRRQTTSTRAAKAQGRAARRRPRIARRDGTCQHPCRLAPARAPVGSRHREGRAWGASSGCWPPARPSS
jgi:hypothetical protein